MKKSLNAVLFLLLLSAFSPARAQGTAFTYQGRLNTGTNLANGTYDLRFAVFDAAAAGNQLGNLLTNSATVVSNGLFTVTLDFGNPFTGAARWLEMGVRSNSVAAFSTLAPRQPVAPAPYAITAGNLSGSLSSSQIIGQLPSTGLAGTYSLPVSFSSGANTFSGSGAALTGVNAATLGGVSSTGFWRTNGNAGANPTNGAFLGTVDNQPLEVRVGNLRALRLESANHNGFAHPTVNFIGGYSGNSAGNGDGVTISGGGGSDGSGVSPNTATTDFASIGGGYGNTVGAEVGTIAGGYFNSVVGGGATGAGFVGGGSENTASGDAAAIGGGIENNASGAAATVGGGSQNTAGGAGAFVGGGGVDGANFIGNTANGNASVIGGGLANSAGGNYATVPGGDSNSAAGTFSFAAGQQAQALHRGAFVWADSQNAAFSSTASNQFLIRAQGGVGIGTASPAKQLDVALSAGPVASGTNSIDPSVALFARNLATTGSESVPNVAGLGFGQSSTRQAIMGGTYGDDFLDFFIGGNLTTPKVRLDHSGHLGIGTISPSATLEVNGNAKVDGAVTATSFVGDGSGLTGVASAINPKQIALLKWGGGRRGNALSVPFSVSAVCFDGANVWAASGGGSTVVRLDASTGVAGGTFNCGAGPVSLCFDGANIWTANKFDKTVTKLSAATGATLGTYALQFSDQPSAIRYDGTNIWVRGTNNFVYVLDDASGAFLGAGIAGSLSFLATADSICFDGANMWIANGSPSNSVTKLGATLNSNGTAPIIGNYPAGSNPTAVCFDGANIWVANSSSANVTKLNASTGATIGTYPVGSGPAAIAFDGTSIWVSNANDNTVSKLNASTGAVLGTFGGTGVLSSPLSMCFDGASIWVGNHGSSSVAKF